MSYYTQSKTEHKEKYGTSFVKIKKYKQFNHNLKAVKDKILIDNNILIDLNAKITREKFL